APSALAVSVHSDVDGELLSSVVLGDAGQVSAELTGLSSGNHVLTLGGADAADNRCEQTVDITVCDALWFADRHGDGSGSPDESAVACTAPLDFVADPTDCDDNDAFTFPGAAPLHDPAACSRDADG